MQKFVISCKLPQLGGLTTLIGVEVDIRESEQPRDTAIKMEDAARSELIFFYKRHDRIKGFEIVSICKL